MKKATVEYYKDEPVALKEVKEFKSDNSYEAYEALCARNKKKKDNDEAVAVAVAVKEKEEAVQRLNRRVAWIALLWTEIELDHGSLTLTDDEYSSMKENFNLGDIKDLDAMPSCFIACYELLKETL